MKTRRKNCGFVKIEVRKDQCLIFFQLCDAPCRDVCNVYLCTRNGIRHYHFLKTIPIQNGTTHYKLELPAAHLTKDRLLFSQCCGILCTDENGNECSTCWDANGELPLYVNKTFTEDIPDTNTDSNPLADNDIIEKLPSKNDRTETLHVENLYPENSSVKDIHIKNPPSEAETTDSPALEPFNEPDVKSISETPSLQVIPSPPEFSEIWEHLQKEFPPLDPFEDHAIVETIKISPSDLGYLKSVHLDLGANRFLLHGYKCYQHLLLGRMHEELRYVLGVPGVYDPQEDFMAKTFGFPDFKPIRECKQKNGQYGYWLRCFRDS